MDNESTARTVARALLDIGAVGFAFDHPITFKSGIKSPVYCDNRTFPFNHAHWRDVIWGFSELVDAKGLAPDVIAGVEAAGIPHSAALGFHRGTPSVFVRKAAKDHGTKKMVEGGDVAGKNVLLVEDLVTTGGSSLAAVRSLRSEGAIVTDVAVIVDYGFPESAEAFAMENVRVHALTDFPTILKEARARDLITSEQADEVGKWAANPRAWGQAAV